MKLLLLAGLFCVCGWSAHGAPADILVSDEPFLNSLNNSTSEAAIRDAAYEKKFEAEFGIKTTTTPAPKIVAAVPIFPVTHPANPSQRAMSPTTPMQYQQPGQTAYPQPGMTGYPGYGGAYGQQMGMAMQPNNYVQQPAPQKSVTPMDLLTSGIMGQMLAPQMPTSPGGQSSSLIPPLIGPGMKENMAKMQQQQQQALHNPQSQQQQPNMYNGYPDVRQMNLPQMNGMSGLGGMGGYQQPMQNYGGIPNFGAAIPSFGGGMPQTQQFLPQASMMQPTMQQQFPMQSSGFGAQPMGQFGQGMGNGGMLTVPQQNLGMQG